MAKAAEYQKGVVSEMSEKKLKVTLVKSTIGAVPKNKKTIEALGLVGCASQGCTVRESRRNLK